MLGRKELKNSCKAAQNKT